MKSFLFLIIFLCTLTTAKAVPGKFEFFVYLSSPSLPLKRKVFVYLPPGYSQAQNNSFPVIYMQDGQNLFDPQRSYMGQTWDAEKTLNILIQAHKMAPVIVVAIDNTPNRMSEYTHDAEIDENGQGGDAHHYLSMIVEILKPVIDRSFRTKKDRSSTAIIGSSLGGLVSLFASVEYGDKFGLIAALSPSIWWNSNSIIDLIQKSHLPLKVYLDSGDSGGEKPKDVQLLTALYQRRGMEKEVSLKSVIQKGAFHSEAFWAQRFPIALQFLFPFSHSK